MTDYTFEKLWPISIHDISKESIRGLSPHDFTRITKSYKKRLIASGYTKRSAKKLTRQLKKMRSQRDRQQMMLQVQALLEHEYRDSPLLDSFYPPRKSKWVNVEKRKYTTSINAENFSLVDNPIDTIKTLSNLARIEGLARSARLNFLDKRVLDIAPYLVFGLLSERMAPYISGGKMSPGTQKVLDAVELRDFLGIEPFHNDLERTDVWPFPLQKRHTPTSTSPAAGDSISFQKVSDRLVDAVNDWLSALPEPRSLSLEAMGKISNIATETLNNAERHSRVEGDGDWVMAGFMARRPVTDDSEEHSHSEVTDYDLDHWYDCHLAFLNRGRPISEAVVTTPDAQILEYIENYQRKHRSKALKGQYSGETLATVCAMQDNISSKPANAGGKGMMTIVEVTNALSLKCVPHKEPKITVLSGKSCIMFSDEYCGFVRDETGSSGRSQMFNQEQCIDVAPSSDHVFDIDMHFPGTVIAVRFTLDPETMEPLNNGN